MGNTDRKVSPVERVYNEGFVTHVDDPADSVARMEGRRGPWIVLNGSVVVAVLDVLSTKKQNVNNVILNHTYTTWFRYTSGGAKSGEYGG